MMTFRITSIDSSVPAAVLCWKTRLSVLTLFCFISADICIAIAISLLMILICGMATYGAYKVQKHTNEIQA